MSGSVAVIHEIVNNRFIILCIVSQSIEIFKKNFNERENEAYQGNLYGTKKSY